MPGLLDLSPGTPEWAAAQHYYPQPMIYPFWNQKAWEYAFSRMPASENIEDRRACRGSEYESAVRSRDRDPRGGRGHGGQRLGTLTVAKFG
jgi:hypothetical protein